MNPLIDYPILAQWSTFLLPENVRKPLVFLTLSEIIEMGHWTKCINNNKLKSLRGNFSSKILDVILL